MKVEIIAIGDELITPALNGSILPGVTRDSIISLARLWGIPCSERRIAIEESLLEAARERSASYWDLARTHYGSVAPISLHRNMHAVMRAASANDGTLGILPLPADGVTLADKQAVNQALSAFLMPAAIGFSYIPCQLKHMLLDETARHQAAFHCHVGPSELEVSPMRAFLVIEYCLRRNALHLFWCNRPDCL